MRKIVTTLLASSLILSGGMSYAASQAGKVMLTAQQIQWKDPYVKLPSGIKMATLEGNPTKSNPYTIRFQYSPHYQVAPLSVPNKETITVISGTIYFAFGDKQDKRKAHKLTAGSFVVVPANTATYRFTREEGAVLQMHGEGPRTVTFVKDGGETGPYKTEDAKKK